MYLCQNLSPPPPTHRTIRGHGEGGEKEGGRVAMEAEKSEKPEKPEKAVKAEKAVKSEGAAKDTEEKGAD